MKTWSSIERTADGSIRVKVVEAGKPNDIRLLEPGASLDGEPAAVVGAAKDVWTPDVLSAFAAVKEAQRKAEEQAAAEEAARQAEAEQQRLADEAAAAAATQALIDDAVAKALGKAA